MEENLIIGPSAEERLKFRLAGLSVKAARSVYHRKRDCSTRDLERVQRLGRLVECHFRSDRPVGFYCGELGVSIKTLNRLASFVLGQTVYQLVMDRRLREARTLLGGSSMLLKEVAAASGFTSPTCFSRFFKDMTGMSPRVYRYYSSQNRER